MGFFGNLFKRKAAEHKGAKREKRVQQKKQ